MPEAGNMTVQLSQPEAILIVDVLDMWLDGLAPAKEASIEDSSITQMGDLLTISAEYDTQKRLIESIKEKIRVNVDAS